MLGFRILFAREEHKRIRLRLVGTREALRDRGYYTSGLPPLGYVRGALTKEDRLARNVLVIEPEGAEVIKRIFRLYLGGKSMTKIAAELGVKLDRVKDTLHNRTYLGEQRNSRGEWIKGRHPPLIDAESFARVHAIIDRRRLGGPRPREAPSETSDWILRDLARCLDCGAKMGAAYGKRETPRRYYYHCTKRCQTRGTRATNGSYVPVREVEAQLDELVIARLAALREDIAKAAEKRAPIVDANDVSAQLAKLDARLKRIAEAHEDGATTREQMRAKVAKVDAERTRLEGELAASVRPSALGTPAARRAMLREVARLADVWHEATPQERRQIVGLLATAAHVGKGRRLRLAWRSVEELAADVRA